MKVGIDIREVRPGRMTGIGRYTLNVLRYLASHTSGHTYCLYSDVDMSERIHGSAFEFRSLSAPTTLWFDCVSLGKAARGDGVDVFYSPYVKAPLNTGCPVVNTVHDLLFLRLKEYRLPRRFLYHKLFAWRGKRVCSNAAYVVTVSHQSKDDIVAAWGVDEEKIKVVPNVISDQFGPDASVDGLLRVRQKHGIEGPYVFYVGNYLPHKNVRRLIEAFAKLPKALLEKHWLVLAGSPDSHQEALKAHARAAGLARRVKFIGFVPDSDLKFLYSGASLFVFPLALRGLWPPAIGGHGLRRASGRRRVELPARGRGGCRRPLQAPGHGLDC